MGSICDQHGFRENGVQVVGQPDGSQHFNLAAVQVKKHQKFFGERAETIAQSDSDLEPDNIASVMSGTAQLVFSFEWMGGWVEVFPEAQCGKNHLCLLDDE